MTSTLVVVTCVLQFVVFVFNCRRCLLNLPNFDCYLFLLNFWGFPWITGKHVEALLGYCHRKVGDITTEGEIIKNRQKESE